MIRILLAEDQALVRGALSALLSLESDIEVLGAAPDGEAAWRDLQRLKPDVLVTDIEMPGLSGLELAQRIIALAGSRSEIRHAPERAGDVRHSRANVDKLASAGFRPGGSLEAGLQATLDHFRSVRVAMNRTTP